MIEAIFFDQDNTLTNSRAVSMQAYRTAIGGLAKKIKVEEEKLWSRWQEEVEKFKISKKPDERRMAYSVEKALEDLGIEAGELGKETEKEMETEFIKLVELNPGVKEFFEMDISQKKILVSEDFENMVRMKLVKFGLTDKFDLVVTNREVGMMKPDINYYKIAWEKLGLDPKKCLYVGDSYEKDLQTGHDNGGKTVIFGKEDARVDFQLFDFRELGPILKSLD